MDALWQHLWRHLKDYSAKSNVTEANAGENKTNPGRRGKALSEVWQYSQIFIVLFRWLKENSDIRYNHTEFVYEPVFGKLVSMIILVCLLYLYLYDSTCYTIGDTLKNDSC